LEKVLQIMVFNGATDRRERGNLILREGEYEIASVEIMKAYSQ